MNDAIRVARREELDPGEVRVVGLGDDTLARRPEALVVVDETGEVRAYLNECQHLPIPLDAGSREFLDDTTGHLRCSTHGALYRRDDGLCVRGPCRGRFLPALPVSVDADGWIVLVAPEEEDDDDELEFVVLEDDEEP